MLKYVKLPFSRARKKVRFKLEMRYSLQFFLEGNRIQKVNTLSQNVEEKKKRHVLSYVSECLGQKKLLYKLSISVNMEYMLQDYEL